MKNRRNEMVMVAALLGGCVCAVLFVFFMMSRTGGAFDMEDANDDRSSARDAPVPGADVARMSEPPPRRGPKPSASAKDVEREKTPPAKTNSGGAAAPEEKTEIPGDDYSGQPAVLTLELVKPAADEERLITVAVKDSEDQPVRGALVVFREGSTVLYRERTDADGVAGFEPFPEEKGPFRIDAVAHGLVSASAASVAVGADVELVMEFRSVLSGEVRAPAKGVGTVRLYTGERTLTTKIRHDGTFVFEDLDPGVLTVTAEVEPYGADSRTVEVRPGESAHVRLNVRTRGRVPIYGEIRIWPGKGDVWINGHRVAVNATGTYKFDRAVSGFNEIVINAPGKAPMRERFTVKPGQKSQYNFVLRREGKIRGRVLDSKTSRPVPDAEVRIGYDIGDPRNDRNDLFPIDFVPVVKTDSQGRFEVDRLDKRMIYLVSIVAPGYGQFFGDAIPQRSRITFRMPRGPFVYGRVRGLGGLPKGAVITTTPLDVQPATRYFNVPAFDHGRGERGRDGLYGLSGLLPGSHLVRVDAPGFGSIETVIDLNEEDRIRLDLRVRRGVDVEQDDVELLRRLPPTVYGPGDDDRDRGENTILLVDANRDPQHVPFGGVHVRFFDGDMEFTAPMEFVELQFELVGLPQGTYRAFLSHPSLKKPLFRSDVRLVHGEPVTLDWK